jgi:hypothetical protein
MRIILLNMDIETFFLLIFFKMPYVNSMLSMEGITHLSHTGLYKVPFSTKIIIHQLGLA